MVKIVNGLGKSIGLGLLALVGFWNSESYAFNLKVEDQDGNPISDFRWLVEEDTTYDVVPGTRVPDPLSVRLHKSHAPVVAKGTSANVNISLPSDTRYFVSILPDSGHALGGAQVAIGQTDVKVVVNKLPFPTAQISIFVFHDNFPINNVPDLPQEEGLSGFAVQLFDAGGRYGQAGGRIMADAFGNPLGTTYNADGSVKSRGTGIIKTGADGVVRIQNLPPGKYGIQAVPPRGKDWQQTSTIEGTKTIDAWVKANEPSYFMEFGPPGHHVFIGFVEKMKNTTVLRGSNEISGRIVNLHNSRPPVYTFWPGQPISSCWIGLNELGAAAGRGIYAQPCNEDGTFTISSVPPGNYQLAIWDENLQLIFAFHGVTVTQGQNVVLEDVPVFNWFSKIESTVFNDRNQNGFRDCVTEECNDPMLDDVGVPEQAVNLRFRDGTLYQSMLTDTEGYVPFDEVFPFFNWLVAEVDYTRFRTTGATFIVDAGGQINPDQGWDYPSRGILTPQPQFDVNGLPIINPNTGNNLSRTETGNTLTQAFQGFLGQTSVLEWGKSPFGPGENGGISGIVHYATTRAENDPRWAVAEEWEAGIPRVQVNLYQDLNKDGLIDDLNKDRAVSLADVDNYPFTNGKRSFPGEEDVDHNQNSKFDKGDAIATTYTDSFDDNPPTNCQGEKFISMGMPTDCFDGLRNFNQVRNGVFDGGYIFEGIPAGTYIVEAITPPEYEHVKEEDKNVDFGEEYQPREKQMPPVCVGENHLIPQYLALFPDQQIPAYRGGQNVPLCDRKQVDLVDGLNAAANFFMFTEVPKAARLVGIVVDDLANEFDPSSPSFGEKFAPPFLPVSIRDWTGREISRVYTDQWGAYNALLPSTFTANIPMPSGMSPNMLTACINAPGPHFSKNYSQFCYTFQYMPGTTTYLDTPVVPIAAFAGPDQFPVDCEQADNTPKIHSVSGPFGGPYVTQFNQQLTIVSQGNVQVLNPAFDSQPGTPKLIERNYGFGNSRGTVRLGTRTLPIVSWNTDTIVVRIPSGTSTGQLTVTRGDNSKSTPAGITVSVRPTGGVHHVHASTTPGATPIQNAIDAAGVGDLILVAPGNYEEMLVMWKKVRLQGWGAGSTFINAAAVPAEKLQRWRDKVTGLLNNGSFNTVPGQPTGPIDAPNNEPALFNTEEGAGITVLARTNGFNSNRNAMIDGLTITGAAHGGGIFANGYARYLQISNNRIMSNYGVYGGGIRIGWPYLNINNEYSDANNDNVTIHHNEVIQNGSIDGPGGGISLGNGSDFYSVTSNFICGNFSQSGGGGIGHMGHSNEGRIAENKIVFNQSFNQGTTVSGGGILISGAPPLPGGSPLTEGSGSVTLVRNRIQSNLAGAGDGGGIRLQFTGGQDVQLNRNSPATWHHIELYNNILVNNVSGLAGGALSLQDSPRVTIVNNTLANNDSLATAGEAFRNGPNQSVPQPAGIVSRPHSTALTAAFGNSSSVSPYKVFSNPTLLNDIIWHDRSFYWSVTANGGKGGLLPLPDAPVFNDLQVLGTALRMNPRYCLMTNVAGYSSTNISVDPRFVREYFNGDRNKILIPEVTTAIQTAPAFDEGGNFIDARFGPLSLTNPQSGLEFGDYHLRTNSAARNRGLLFSQESDVIRDFDNQLRTNSIDIGADEVI